MEPLGFFCASTCLIMLSVGTLTLAILRYGTEERHRNRRSAELTWQARNRHTDWWLDINRKSDNPRLDDDRNRR
ncbi:MAG: hypothetical protein ACLFTK_04265 [Anaerolineales bacterium]